MTVTDVDLDAQFRLPRDDYDVVFFLGVLYHLKNPFYALEMLAGSTRYCLMSTRVTQWAGEPTAIENLPVAYLLGPQEANNDPTNFWIFSKVALLRLFGRTGWDVLDLATFGDTTASDPTSPDRDERAFALLRSRSQ